MLKNEVDVCNSALAQIGHDRTIQSLSEGSTEANRCNLFFGRALDRVLSSHTWIFALGEFNTIELGFQDSSGNEAVGNEQPIEDLVRIVDATDNDGNRIDVLQYTDYYTWPSKLYLTKVPAKVRYIKRPKLGTGETFEDSPVYFKEAVACVLASMLYLPMFGYPAGTQTENPQKLLDEQAEASIAKAVAAETSEMNAVWTNRNGVPSSELDICNKALILLGSGVLIWDFLKDPSDTASACRIQYDSAVQTVLSSFNWEFALDSVELNKGVEQKIPSSCIRIADARDKNGEPVRIVRLTGGKVSAEKDCTLRYVSRDTKLEDMPRAVIEAIVLRLAALLYNNVSSSKQEDAASSNEKGKYFLEQADKKLQEAKASEIAEHAYMGARNGSDDAAKTAICNEALSIAGSPVMIRDFQEDPSEVAVLCRLMYKTAVNDVLGSHDWDFACVEEPLMSSCDMGVFRITVPEDCLRVSSVRDENGLNLDTERVRGHIVVKGLSTSGRVILRYVTSDVRESDFPPGVRKAVSYRLAALIAGSISNATGGGIGVERAEQLAQSHLLVAMARDANDTQHSRKMDNPIERARR